MKTHKQVAFMDIKDLFTEYDTDNVVVEDFGIVFQECLITNLVHNEDDTVSIWCGDPDEDEFAEELLLSKEQQKEVFDEILDNIN